MSRCELQVASLFFRHEEIPRGVREVLRGRHLHDLRLGHRQEAEDAQLARVGRAGVPLRGLQLGQQVPHHADGQVPECAAAAFKEEDGTSWTSCITK